MKLDERINEILGNLSSRGRSKFLEGQLSEQGREEFLDYNIDVAFVQDQSSNYSDDIEKIFSFTTIHDKIFFSFRGYESSYDDPHLESYGQVWKKEVVEYRYVSEL